MSILRRKNGFTLIELLVVIAIISLLVSILVPSLNRAKKLARRVVCQSNLKHIGLTMHMYAQSNNSLFPYREAHNMEEVFTGWAWLLSDGGYITEGKLFACPNATTEPFNWYYAPPDRSSCMTYYYVGNWGVINFPDGSGISRPRNKLTCDTGLVITQDGSTFAGVPNHTGGVNALMVGGHACWVETWAGQTSDEFYNGDY